MICPECRKSFDGLGKGAHCPEHDHLLVAERALQKYEDDEMLGRRVADRFDIIDVIGVGGFGAVYRAIQQPVGREVALKLIRPQLQHREQVRARFFREARVVATLKDPTIVTLYDYGEDDGVLFAAFEFVDGVPLQNILAEGRLEPDRATRLAVEVLRALAVAHRNGLIHRDIKPANIMILTDHFGQETVKVLDFGIAKVLERIEGEAASVETQAGALLGTPRYMAPEQARGESIDARADLYSLAVVVYEMLSGGPPFTGTSLETAVAHATRQPPAFDAGLDLPEKLVEVVFTALSKKPSQRYTSATNMAEALVEAMPRLTYTNSFVEVSASSVNMHASLISAPPVAAGPPSVEAAEPTLVPEPASRSWIVPAVIVGAVIATIVLIMLSDGTKSGDGPASTPTVAPATAPATTAPATTAPATAAPATAAPATAAPVTAAPVTAAPATAAPATAAPATAAPATAAPKTAPSRAPRTRRPQRPATTPSAAPKTQPKITVPEF